jgi:phage terminase Nu1 subunit (DNA packaging protein)
MAGKQALSVAPADRELVQSALEKRRRGAKPNQTELRALARFERQKEEADRWRHYSTIPKKHWQEMSGRQQKILNDQAGTWGIPIGGREIDLSAVVRWLHQFLADNAIKLRGADSDDPMMAGAVSPWLEEFRKEQTFLARLKRRELEGALIPRDVIHDALARIASILRGAGAVLQRQFGPEAHQILDEALDDAEREIESLCGALAADGDATPTDAETDNPS